MFQRVIFVPKQLKNFSSFLRHNPPYCEVHFSVPDSFFKIRYYFLPSASFPNMRGKYSSTLNNYKD